MAKNTIKTQTIEPTLGELNVKPIIEKSIAAHIKAKGNDGLNTLSKIKHFLFGFTAHTSSAGRLQLIRNNNPSFLLYYNQLQ